MLLRNRSTNEVVASQVVVAVNPLARSIGFLRRKTVPPSEGMWFPNCWAIHTVGMRATIDVLFLDDENRVVNLRPFVPPNRIVAAYGAATVVELGAGALEAVDVLVGDRLDLEA
jgi:uncharacterized protein